MKTKLEKEIEWIEGQGYPSPNSDITLLCLSNYNNVVLTRMAERARYVAKHYKFCDFLGIVKDGKLIPIPEFQDDEDEQFSKSIDLSLTIYANSRFCQVMEASAWHETNNRIRALEFLVKQLEIKTNFLEEEI